MPCRWAIPNTSAMARSTSSRLGWADCPILFIVLIYKALRCRRKKAGCVRRSAQSTFEAPKRIFELRTIRLCKSCAQSSLTTWTSPTFCRNARVPVWSKRHTFSSSHCRTCWAAVSKFYASIAESACGQTRDLEIRGAFGLVREGIHIVGDDRLSI